MNEENQIQETETNLKQIIDLVKTENILLAKLNSLLKEEANIADSFLLWTVKYCADHNIPIGEEKQFKNQIADTKRILEEIDKTSTSLDDNINSIALKIGWYERRNPNITTEEKP